MDPQNRTQLTNSFKYLSKMLPPLVVVALGREGPYFWLYVLSQVFATIFVTSWDYYMDWGLLRGTGPNPPLLRNQLTFEPTFYYKCMIINLIFRHFWIVPLAAPSLGGPYLSSIQPALTLTVLVEAVRRTIWAVIRVENESINNFEEYRSINTIPPIKEESEGSQQ